MEEKYGYRCLTASGVLYTLDCRIYGVVVTTDGATASYIDIFDGPTASMPLVMRIRAAATASAILIFDKPLLLSRGCYVTLGATISHATILSEPSQT